MDSLIEGALLSAITLQISGQARSARFTHDHENCTRLYHEKRPSD